MSFHTPWLSHYKHLTIDFSDLPKHEDKILPIETPINLPGLDLDSLQQIDVPVIVQPDEEQQRNAPDTLGIEQNLLPRAWTLSVDQSPVPSPVSSVVATLPVYIPAYRITEPSIPSPTNDPFITPFIGAVSPKSKDSGMGLPKLPDPAYLRVPVQSNNNTSSNASKVDSGSPLKQLPKLPLPLLQNRAPQDDVPKDCSLENCPEPLPLPTPVPSLLPSDDGEDMDGEGQRDSEEQDLDWCDSYDDNGYWYNGQYHEWSYDAEQ